MKEHLCPNCKQPIYDDEALLCHFCGESLGRASSGALGQVKDRGHKWLLALIILLVLASFVMLMIR